MPSTTVEKLEKDASALHKRRDTLQGQLNDLDRQIRDERKEQAQALALGREPAKARGQLPELEAERSTVQDAIALIDEQIAANATATATATVEAKKQRMADLLGRVSARRDEMATLLEDSNEYLISVVNRLDHALQDESGARSEWVRIARELGQLSARNVGDPFPFREPNCPAPHGRAVWDALRAVLQARENEARAVVQKAAAQRNREREQKQREKIYGSLRPVAEMIEQ
jgi:phosphoglycolate phosphatase-like HAD superfamily hydrolase